MSPIEARRKIRLLQLEGYRKAEIARMLNPRRRSAAEIIRTDAITVRKLLKIRRLYRLLVAEEADEADSQAV